MSLYRKHRPQNFSDLIGQDHIRDTLLQASRQGKIAHAYLFCGPRGTGKTTAARILAKAVNCSSLKDGEPCNACRECKEIQANKAIDIIEIDAASNRGIDEIRELRENVRFAPSTLKMKVYIIDEVHMLTREAFNALLKTLEEPPAHAMFILATTEAHKIPATIISRTQRFDFRRVKKDDIIRNLNIVVKAEGIKIDKKALDIIATSAEGGHRDSLSLLEQISSYEKDITGEVVEKVLGISKKEEIFALIWAIFNTDAEEGLKIAHQVFENGGSMSQFNSQVIEVLRKVLLSISSDKPIFEDTAENIEKISEIAKKFSEKYKNAASITVVKVIERFISSGRLLKDVAYPVIPLEIAVVEAVSILSKDKIVNSEKRKANSDSKQISDSNDQISKAVIPNLPKMTLRANVEGSMKKDSSVSQSDNDTNLAPSTYNLTPDAPATVPVKELAEPEEVAEVQIFEQLSVDLWKKIVQNIKQTNNSLAALLRDARPLRKEDNFIVLGVKFAFHKDKISEPANVSIIEAEVKNVTGTDCKVKCEIADMTKKARKPASEDELAAAAEEIFNS